MSSIPFWLVALIADGALSGTTLGGVGPGEVVFAQRKLKKVDIAGGLPQTVCDVGDGWEGTWNWQGTIVFAASSDNRSVLNRVSSAGGEAVAITKAGDVNYRFPYFLPDGTHFIYYVSALMPGSNAMLSPPNEVTGIHVRALDTSDDQRLLTSDSAAIYAAPGYLLFVRQGGSLLKLLRLQRVV